LCGDILDQMAGQYSRKSGSRMWPLQVFFSALDMTAISVWILYKTLMEIKSTGKILF